VTCAGIVDANNREDVIAVASNAHNQGKLRSDFFNHAKIPTEKAIPRIKILLAVLNIVVSKANTVGLNNNPRLNNIIRPLYVKLCSKLAMCSSLKPIAVLDL
jgi:hypothetical protein